MNISALKFHDFRIYLGGNVFALNAVWMQRVTLGWLAWQLTNSASFVGFIAFINYAPTMITGPFFGVLVDRMRVKHAAMATQTSLLVLAAVLLGFYSFGHLGPVSLAILAGLTGIVMSAHNPVRMSLGPRLVDRDSVASVITLIAINFNLARMTGPALGGWVISTWGVGTALFLQTVFILPFLFAIMKLNPRQRMRPRGTHEPFWQALRAGVQYVLSSALIRQALVVTALFAVPLRGLLEILPVLADGVFDRGAGGLGLLTACAGFGALMACLVKALRPVQPQGILPRPVLLCAIAGIALLPLIGQAYSWGLSLVLIACIAFVSTLCGVTMQTAIQLHLDDDMRGRVMSLWGMVGIGAAATGAIWLGLLSEAIGYAAALSWTGGVAFVLLGLFVAKTWSAPYEQPGY